MVAAAGDCHRAAFVKLVSGFRSCPRVIYRQMPRRVNRFFEQILWSWWQSPRCETRGKAELRRPAQRRAARPWPARRRRARDSLGSAPGPAQFSAPAENTGRRTFLNINRQQRNAGRVPPRPGRVGSQISESGWPKSTPAEAFPNFFMFTLPPPPDRFQPKIIMSEPIPYLDLKAQLKPLRAEIDAAISRTLDNCSFCPGPDVVAV